MYNEIIGKPELWLSSAYLHQNKNARHLGVTKYLLLPFIFFFFDIGVQDKIYF